MKLARIGGRAGRSFWFTAAAALFVVVAGCSDADSGKIEYSQKFEAPAGSKAIEHDPNAPVQSRADRRRREIEESREEAKQPASKSRRARH